jgi:hypothetical protein
MAAVDAIQELSSAPINLNLDRFLTLLGCLEAPLLAFLLGI